MVDRLMKLAEVPYAVLYYKYAGRYAGGVS